MGRNIAKRFNIRTLGVLGILKLAKNKKIKEKQDILKNIETLISKGFYLSSEVVISFINNL